MAARGWHAWRLRGPRLPCCSPAPWALPVRRAGVASPSVARCGRAARGRSTIAASPPLSPPSATTAPSPARRPPFGVVFDVDGVLVRGDRVLPSTRAVFQRLQQQGVPAIFMTNGGGTTEAAKAAEYSRKFGVPIDPDQVVLAHTPIRLLADQYRDKIVLILGNDVCRDVARSYGFKHPVTSDDILSQFPDLWPFRELPPDYPRYTQHDFAKEPVSAIFSFHDSWDWGRDAQICMDLLLSEKGQLGTRHQCQPGEARVGAIPFYACNQDFLWSNAHPHARFAHGAFRRVLEYLWRELGAGDTGNSTEADRRAVPPLALIKYGKPERPAYVFADAALRAWAARLHLSGPPSPEASSEASSKSSPESDAWPSVVYAIGDNPHSDIAGANAWGWHGILVETGVYERGVSPETHGAQHVAADAGEAIDYIFARHGIHN